MVTSQRLGLPSIMGSNLYEIFQGIKYQVLPIYGISKLHHRGIDDKLEGLVKGG